MHTLNNEEKNTIVLTLVLNGEEYQIQTREKQYFSLMTLISDNLSILGFGLCSGMGSCGTCLVEIDGRYTLACEVPVTDELANSRIIIDSSRI